MVDYHNFREQSSHFDQCLDRIKADPEICRQLLQATSCNEFSRLFHSSLQELQKDISRKEIDDWLDLSLHFRPPLSSYKPQINLELEEIHGTVKPVIITLYFIENLVEKITRKPFGGWRNRILLMFTGKRQPPLRDPPSVSLPGSMPVCTEMQALFNRLGKERWRQHIDWEDQELGDRVYDTGTHGGDVEPGYIGSAMEAHTLAAKMLGVQLDLDKYELLFLAGRKHIQKHIRYDTTPRNLWRLRHLLDNDVYADIDPEHIRYIPHYRWEVMAFNYLYRRYSERFRSENPCVAEYFSARYGNHPKITKRILDREFMRCQICFFDHFHDDSQIRQAITGKLSEFYRRMNELGYNLQTGQRKDGNEEAGLYTIADLIRWLEILHPFRGGNTRHHINLLNKLLVEAGFCPTILANRNDAPYLSTRGWKDRIVTGMLRWEIVCGLIETGLYPHLLQIRPQHYVYHQR